MVAALKARLANYKIPKLFFIDEELPLLPIGKVDKQRLRQGLRDRQAGATNV